MGAAEDIVDELLDLVEVSAENSMEEFLNDLVQIPSKVMVEESLEDLLKISSKNKLDEILCDLIGVTYSDEVEQLLNDIVEISSKDIAEENDLNDAAIDETVDQLLATLIEVVSSRDTVDQQLLEDLVQMTINNPTKEILKEMSKMSSSKDSVKISFKNSSKKFPKKDFMEDKQSEALITESFKDLIKQSNEPISNDSNHTVKLHPPPKNFFTKNATNIYAEKAYSMSTAVEKSVIYRRNDPGTTREEWCNWPDMPFEEMDNTLNVQQYIQQCIHKDPSDVDTILKAPPGQEEGVWKYEHVRQFCMQLNGLTLLLQDECKPDVCVQMTATEQWIFLCAAHKNPKECSAIDYTRHTLDGAAALLNSNKYFPSRVSIKESSIAKIGSVCRRIYRIFSHAYFHHPELFEKFEIETHLCRRFTVFVKKYNLMANEHLIVPILEHKSNHP